MILEFAEQKVFSRPRVIILNSRAEPSALRRYLSEEEPKFMRQIFPVWKKQAKVVSENHAEWMIRAGSMPQVLEDEWTKLAIEFFKEKGRPALENALTRAGERVARKLNEPRKQQEFSFDPTRVRVLNWMRERGGILIRELSAAQAAAINALLQHQIFIGITSPYQLLRMIKPQIGLLRREALAVAGYRADLVIQGLSASTVERLTERYASHLHTLRAERIARTELAYAHEFGQWESLRQAQEAGFVDEVEKIWMTADDERLCDDCNDMDGETVGHDELFSCGLVSPPLHPSCRCTLGYRVIGR